MDEDMTCTTTETFNPNNVTEIDYFYEYEMIMKSRKSQMWDRLHDTEVVANNAMFIMIYGLGGLLVFFVIYTLCTSYVITVRDNLENARREREADARRPRMLLPTPTPPPESVDRRFFPEHFQDMFNLNTIPKQMSQSSRELRSSHVEINMSSYSPESADRQARFSPERISRSTPSSCNVVRRQLHGSDAIPRRPSSWL